MAECSLPGDRLVCDNCGRDTFAIQRENGLEVKYRDRWVLILNDMVGTVLFRCRFCKSVTAHHLGTASVVGLGPATRREQPHGQPGAATDRDGQVVDDGI
jgi:hypothetical protein